jgi:3-methyladenine DNA glycosylase AlkD
MDSGELWLQRVCLIFQLTYKENTDSTLLFGYIRRVAGSKDFFLQKGAIWALRQYARTNRDAVRAYAEREKLAPSTRRETLKHL